MWALPSTLAPTARCISWQPPPPPNESYVDPSAKPVAAHTPASILLHGVTNQAADATSRHPVPCDYLATIASTDCASPDHEETALLAAVEQDISRNFCLQWSEIAHEIDSDAALKELLPAIQSGFPSDYSGSTPVRPYLPFRDGYFVHNGVVLYYDRIVIPLSLRHKVLSMLHSAHQGVSVMERRARATVFWPGMTKDIQVVRSSCVHCNRNAPSQAVPPPIGSTPPTTPFQKIFAGFF